MSTTHAARGPLAAMALGAALISTSAVFVEWVRIGPTASAFWRMGLAAVLLLAWLQRPAVRAGWRPAPRVLALVAVAAVFFALDLWMWHRSILYAGVGLATLLGNFQVFLMALAGFLIYRERLGWPFLVGVALAFVGLYLLVGLDWGGVGAQYHLGVALGIATGVCYAAYMLSTRHAQRAGHVRLAPAQLLCVSTLLCALVLGVATLLEGDSFALPDAQSWSALLGLGFFGQVLGWVLLTRAMPQLPASLIGLLLLLQPALSFLFDVILFARPTRALDWIGVGLSLLGIFIGSYRRPAPAAEPVSDSA